MVYDLCNIESHWLAYRATTWIKRRKKNPNIKRHIERKHDETYPGQHTRERKNSSYFPRQTLKIPTLSQNRLHLKKSGTFIGVVDPWLSIGQQPLTWTMGWKKCFFFVMQPEILYIEFLKIIQNLIFL